MQRQIHPLATTLNADLETADFPLTSLLSRTGRRAYFPVRGILGQSAEAKGAAINATIGMAFEEDGSPLCLECVEELLRLPSEVLLYAPSFGLPDLRERRRAMLIEKNPTLRGKSFGLPLVTHALTHGLAVAGQLFIDPGESVILPDLYWDNYDLLFEEQCGARLKTFPLFVKDAFNVAGLRQRLLSPGAKKILLLNFPNNPTGYTATEAEAAAICAAVHDAAVAGKRVIVILDDAYFGLVYEPGVCRESLFAQLADIHPGVLTVKLDAATKEDYVWGLRMGFMTFGAQGAGPAQYRALEAKAAGLIRGSISSASSVGQHLLLKAYNHPDCARQKQQKYDILRARYLRIREIFAAHPEFADSFEPLPFNSGYFMCVRPLGVDPEAVRRRLLERGAGTIMLAGLIRLAFSAVPLPKLEKLFVDLHAVIRELQGAAER